MICFQKIYGFHALNHQIIEKSWDVTPVHTHTYTVESSVVFCLSRIRNSRYGQDTYWSSLHSHEHHYSPFHQYQTFPGLKDVWNKEYDDFLAKQGGKEWEYIIEYPPVKGFFDLWKPTTVQSTFYQWRKLRIAIYSLDQLLIRFKK